MLKFLKGIIVFLIPIAIIGIVTEPYYPATSTEKLTELLRSSDDFNTYNVQFVAASRKLLRQGTCSLAEIKEYQGWVVSQSYKPSPAYFTYCGEKRVYLNASTGRIFRQ